MGRKTVIAISSVSVARHAKSENRKNPQKHEFNIKDPTKPRKYGGLNVQNYDVFCG